MTFLFSLTRLKRLTYCHLHTQILKKQCKRQQRYKKNYGANIDWFLTKTFPTFPYDLLSLNCACLNYKRRFFFTHFDVTFLSLEVVHNGVKYFLKESSAFSRVIIVRFKSCEIAVAWKKNDPSEIGKPHCALVVQCVKICKYSNLEHYDV